MTPSTSEWTGIDASLLRDFLEGETGKRMLYHLSEAQPELLDGKDNGMTLVASGRVGGYALALKTLLSLTVEPPQSVPEVHDDWPDLNDEEAWSKLEVSEK